MGAYLIVASLIWGITELCLYLLKRPYPGRVTTGAWWAFGSMVAIMVAGAMFSSEMDTWKAVVIALVINGPAIMLLYWLRLAIDRAVMRMLNISTIPTRPSISNSRDE